MPKPKTEFQSKQQDKWLDAFDDASPKQRYQLLLEALQAPMPFLSAEALAFATATVNQMLGLHNLLAEQAEIAGLLKLRSPEAYAMLLPPLQMLEFSHALHLDQAERLPQLFRELLAYSGEIPARHWQMLLDVLAYYGHPALAADEARQLQQKLSPTLLEIEEEFAFCLESHRIFHSLESYWRSGCDDAARKAFAKEIRATLEDEEDVRFYLLQGESDYAKQLARLKSSLMARDVTDALTHAQLAFGLWMLERYGLNLYCSARMMELIFMIWTLPPLKGTLALDRIARLSREQLIEAYEIYNEGPDLLEAFVFCWGLPHVYAWLQELGLSGARETEKILATLTELKHDLAQDRGLVLWSFDFVHHWPRSPLIGAEAFAAEAAAFRATRQSSLTLSENPEDNQLFESDSEAEEELVAYEIPTAMIEELLGNLTALKPNERLEQLSAIELEFGPQAADSIRQMLVQHLETPLGSRGPANAGPPSGKSTEKAKGGAKIKGEETAKGSEKPKTGKKAKASKKGKSGWHKPGK
ncbi:MAG TPA: hypothetical protein V6D23_11935 [Candidatus Obscuribacterales bacterium]